MFKRIVAALDGSDTASRAFESALTLAAETGAELKPVYVIDIPVLAYDAPGFDPCIIQDAFVEEGKRIMGDAQKRMTARGVSGTPRTVEAQMPGEDIAQRIVATASEWHADVIVMGTHGLRGVSRLMLGSVAERVLRRAHCPVLLIPASVGASPASPAFHSLAEKELS